MFILFVIFILPLIVSGIAAYVISAYLHSKLLKAGNKNAKAFSVIIFIGVFLLTLAVAILLLNVLDIRFER